jgi:membrane-associated phospholipid phosphatase
MTEISPAGMIRWRIVGLLAGSALFMSGLLLWRVLPEWDGAMAAAFRLRASHPATRLFVSLTQLGGAAVMIPVALIAAAGLRSAGHLRKSIWLLLTLGGGRIAVEMMKYLVGRARPAASHHLVDVATASFPSSHSAGTAMTVLALLAIARCRRRIWIAGFAFILTIGLSRVMLGVHWPSDVLAGWGFGLFWVAACFSEKFLLGGVNIQLQPLRIRDRPSSNRDREP